MPPTTRLPEECADAIDAALSEDMLGVPALHGTVMRRNFCWTFVGNVIYAACQWGMLVAIAKLGTTAMVGRFGIALAVTAPVIMFTNLQLGTIQATDARLQFLFGDYLGLRLISTVLAMLAIAGISECSGYAGPVTAVVLAVGLAKSFEAVGDVVYGLFTQREQLHYMAKSMIARGILSLSAIAVGLKITGSVLSAAIALAVVNALVLLCYDLRNGAFILTKSGRDTTRCIGWWPCPRWDRRRLIQMTLMTLPMGAVALLSSLNINIPRYFIERFSGEHALGIFIAMAYMQVAGTTVVRALGQSVCSRLATYYADFNIPAYRNIMLKLLGAGVLLSVVGVLIAWGAGPQLLSVIYKPEYAAYSHTFVLLMVGSAGLYLAMFLGYGLTAARQLNVQTTLMLVASIITTAMCAVLVPHGGINGAAMALIIGNCAWVIGSLFVLLHVLHADKKARLQSCSATGGGLDED